MMRSMLAVMLLAATGNSRGQSGLSNPGAGNLQGALTTLFVGSTRFSGGLVGGTEMFLAGHVTEGFKDNTNGFSGFAVLLTQDTPFASFGTNAAQTFQGIYASLVPTYEVFDGPAAQLASLGTPLTQPLSNLLVTLYTPPALPGLENTYY